MSHGTSIRKIFPGYLARARARARARPSRAGGPPARIRRKCLKIRRWRARAFLEFRFFFFVWEGHDPGVDVLIVCELILRRFYFLLFLL